MKVIKYFTVFCFVLVSCTYKKNLTDKVVLAKGMSAKKVARKHVASYFDGNTINAKLKANFNNSKIKQSISVNLRMKKDEVIWLKGSKFITVFKAKITPTTVSYYSPFAKNYFKGDFKMLKKLFGVDINFKQLQNLLLGQSLQDVKSQKQNVIIKDNAYILSPEKQAALFDIFFAVNATHFKLDNQIIRNTSKNQRLEILYPTYSAVDNVVFPSEINIKAIQPNSLTTIDFFVKGIEFDTDFETSFTIPKGYKEIKL